MPSKGEKSGMKSLFERMSKRIVKPHYQLMFLLFSFFIIAWMGHYAMRLFRPLEKYPHLLSITPEKIRTWGGEPVSVDVGLYITNWYAYDIVKNTFTFDGVVWFHFDPALVSPDTIGKFTFEKGELMLKARQDSRLIDGKLLAEYKVRLKFSSILIHQLFPFDDHRIFIPLVNTFVSPSEVIFRSYKSNFVISKKVEIPGWKEVDHSVVTGYDEENIDEFDKQKTIRYPKAVFSVDFSRMGNSLTLLIFLPIFLISFLSIFWLSFKPTDGRAIISLSTSAITSLIAYRFVTQNMSPKVGYFLLSDNMFMFFLALTFISFVCSLLWMRHGKMTARFIKAKGAVFVFFHVLVISVWYYFLFWWIR